MPHTSRKRKTFEHPKRHEVVDEDGWTRVVTSSARNLAKMNLAPAAARNADRSETSGYVSPTKTEVPLDQTVKTLVARFAKLQQQWLSSASHTALVSTISMHQRGRKKNVTRCILLGSGTFCGLSAGWIGRHDVALLQAAVFLSVVHAIDALQGASVRTECYAQEPLYNSLDHEFLRQFEVQVLDDPAGLAQIGDTTFVYAPGAERSVAKSVYRANPAMVLSHHAAGYGLALNDGTTTAAHSTVTADDMLDVVEKYLETHDSVRLPDFDMANEPFHQQYLHYCKYSEQYQD